MESLFILDVSGIAVLVSGVEGVVVDVVTLSADELVSEPVAGCGVSQATIPNRSIAKRRTLFINYCLSNCNTGRPENYNQHSCHKS